MSTNRLQRYSVLILSSRVSNAVVMFAGIVYFTRILDVSAIGSFFLFQSILQVTIHFSDFSIKTAVEKHISSEAEKGTVIATGGLLKFFALCIACIVLWLMRFWLVEFIGLAVVSLLILCVVLEALGNFLIHIISGDLRLGDTAIIRVSRQVTWFAGGALLIYVGFGQIAIIYSYVAGTGVMALWAFVRCDLAINRPTSAQAKSLLQYAKYDLVGGTSHRVHNWVDVLLLGYFLSPLVVGAYEIVWKIAVLSDIVSTSVSRVLFPEASNAAELRPETLKKLLETAVVWATILIVPMVFGAFILADELLVYVFRIDVPKTAPALVTLLCGRLMFAHFQPIKSVLDGLNRVHLSARATGLSAVANIALNYVLIPSLDLLGAAVGTATAMAIGTVVIYAYVDKHLSFQYPTTEVSIFVMASLLVTGVVTLLQSFFPVRSLPVLLGTIGIGSIVYIVVVLRVEVTRRFVLEQYQSVT